MDNKILNLCPFCGGEAYETPSGVKGLAVRCGVCSARTVSDFPENARKEWNKRASSEISGKPEEKWVFDLIRERDSAQHAADTLTSLVLGEGIDWAFHDAKWLEAIELLQNPPKREIVAPVESVKDRLQRQGVEALFREAQAKVKPLVDKEREAEGSVDNIRMGNKAETPPTWTVYDLDDPKGYKTFYSDAAARAHSEKITKIEDGSTND